MGAVDLRAVATAFAAILRTARVGAGLSKEKLAEAADIDRTYPSLLGATTGVAAADVGGADCGCFGVEDGAGSVGHHDGRETAQGGSMKRPRKSITSRQAPYRRLKLTLSTRRKESRPRALKEPGVHI
jgi:hypothetical protein